MSENRYSNMGMFIAVLLLTVTGTLGNYNTCLYRLEEKCVHLSTLNYNELNITPEILLELCQEEQDILQCKIEEVKEECGQYSNTTGILKRVLNYLKKVCNPDSEIYKVISNNFDCLSGNTFRNCKINEELRKVLMTTRSGREVNRKCQGNIEYNVCIPVMIAKGCKEQVVEAILEVIMETDLPFHCPEEIIDIFKDVIGSMHISQIFENVELEDYK